MANEGFFELGLQDVAGRPINETGVKVSFVRVSDNKVISTASNLAFPPPHRFAVPAFPQEKNLVCEVALPRYRQRRSGIFTLTDGETIVRHLTLFRRPDKFSSRFTEWDQLPSHYLPFKSILNRSSAVKVKGGKTLGKFTEATYDGVTDKAEVAAKAALLNLYAKLTDLKEPTKGKEPWFSFVKEIVEIGKERFIAVVDPRMGEIVRAIKNDIGKFKDYKDTPAQNHFGNIPAAFNPQKSKMFSIKSTEDHGNLQLTLVPGRDAGGNDLLVLDVDIDENGRLLAHLADLFKHKFTGGTHPFDIHEYLALTNPSRPLGYELV
ncbi:MAG: hypothetical protein ACRD9R_06010 [Pyrinomonadaceae bacterium]